MVHSCCFEYIPYDCVKLILSGFFGTISDAGQAHEPAKDDRDEEELGEELSSSVILVLHATDDNEDEEEELLGSLMLF